MNIRFNRRGVSCATLIFDFGKVVWRCANGSPNHERSYALHLHNFSCLHKDRARIFLLPSLSWCPWHKSNLATNADLGTTYNATALSFLWLIFEFDLSWSSSTHQRTKYHDEHNL